MMLVYWRHFPSNGVVTPPPSLPATPFARMRGEAAVSRLVARFYAIMAQREPELAGLHRLDDLGLVHPDAQENFRLFLLGWLGGPQTYMERHGHPRLRMRHGHLAIDDRMAEAWMRSMKAALQDGEAAGDFDAALRGYLEQRLGEVAAFLRNRPE